MKYTELILKVSGRCNLNCDYCYVFNKGDKSYMREPARMSEELIKPVVMRINEHCQNNNISHFFVIFHGGEPLLQPKSFYKMFVETVKNIIHKTHVSYGLQTNATLLTQEWIDLFCSLGIRVGVSIDGPRLASSHRVFRSDGSNAYDSIVAGISLLKKNDLPISVLSVMNVDYPAHLTYQHLKDLCVDSADFLFPDTTFDSDIPTGMSSWLLQLFTCWYEDNERKPIIRLFESVVKMLLGQDCGYEILGQRDNATIGIKTNGNIEIVDSMKVCGDGFTYTGLNVLQNSFEDTFSNETLKLYYNAHHDVFLCYKCRNCIIKEICGGGKLPHRYSTRNGFDNTSVYCECIKDLVVHAQNYLFKDLPDLFNKCSLVKLRNVL